MIHTARRIAVLTLAAVIVSIGRGPVHAQTADQHPDPHPSGGGPEVVAHAFGSVDWAAAEQPERLNTFALGQLALFVTASINDRVSVLAEVVMEASAADTEVDVDLERLQLTYRMNDHLSLSAGRYHTGIGYYNAAFHHGSYFEIPVGRPRIFRFEDEGGVLPIHEVGLSARGRVPKTGSALYYVAEVGNGRRWTDIEERPGFDQNTAKSTNAGLALRPELWRGVELGGSFYRDQIPASTDTSVDHRITAAYAVYRTGRTELMGEWLRLFYRRADGQTSVDHGGYLQASHAFGRLRPYYRYDRLDIDPATPFIGGFGSSLTHVLGVRLDPAPWIGLKAQYERQHQNENAGHGVHVQLVFVF